MRDEDEAEDFLTGIARMMRAFRFQRKPKPDSRTRGKSFEEATRICIAETEAEIAKLKSQQQRLRDELAAREVLVPKLGDNLGRFAAGIRTKGTPATVANTETITRRMYANEN